MARMCLFLVPLVALPAAAQNSSRPSGGTTQGVGSVSGVSDGPIGFFLESLEWGRLVDVYDQRGVRVASEVLVREDLQSDGVNYLLDVNAVTEVENLTILRIAGSAPFRNLLSAAQTGLDTVEAKGVQGSAPFSMVPRNATMRLNFSQELRPLSVTEETVQVLVGNPPTQAQAVRRIVQNRGRKGSVLLDVTVSQREAAVLGLPRNAIGYPQAANTVDASWRLRIPTKVDLSIGQSMILRSRFGKGLAVKPGEPIELSPNSDPIVVRAARTGSAADPFRGFMQDLRKPRLVTTQPAEIQRIVAVIGAPSLRTIHYRITSDNCRGIQPKAGDVLVRGSNLATVCQVVDASNPLEYIVKAVVLEGDLPPGNYSANPLNADLTTAYAQQDAALQLCWIRFSPEPGTLPGEDVDPYSSLILEFDEPLDKASVSAMDSLVLCAYEIDPNPGGEDPTRQFRGDVNGGPSNETVGEYIDRQVGFTVSGGGGRILFGPIESQDDQRDWMLTPLRGLADSNQDQILNLCLALRDDSRGLKDLGGNSIGLSDFVAGTVGQLNRISVAGNPGSWPTDQYFALRATSLDEDGDGFAEYKGQIGSIQGDLLPRPMQRFSRVADPANPYIGRGIAFGAGVMTPLVPSGSVAMSTYRYLDLGLGLQDPTTYNLDVEGLSWSPFGGQVFADTFDRYSLALSHSNRFPDEGINPHSGYPLHPQSGLDRVADFDQNILGFPNYDEQIVFDQAYVIDPSDLFTSSTGSAMMPYPEFDETYTWRDTGLPSDLLGAPSGQGVPPSVVGSPTVYAANEVPSVALPLLTRVRCYPRGQFFGFNGFQVQLMVASSALPAFRVFSSGGRDAGQAWHQVVPDDPVTGGTRPIGGYNTVTGARTSSFGPEVYWGQVDFVTRVSRVHTHWFRLGGVPVDISAFLVELTNGALPEGTDLVLEARGSTSINLSGCNLQLDPTPITDANCTDAYGERDPNAVCCGMVNTVTDWNPDLQRLVQDGAEYMQLRFTFVSNLETGESPGINSLGMAWSLP